MGVSRKPSMELHSKELPNNERKEEDIATPFEKILIPRRKKTNY